MFEAGLKLAAELTLLEEKNERLQAEVERLRDEARSYREANEAARVCEKHTSEFIGNGCLVCERDALAEALRYYADRSEYSAVCCADGGQKAREALAALDALDAPADCPVCGPLRPGQQHKGYCSAAPTEECEGCAKGWMMGPKDTIRRGCHYAGDGNWIPCTAAQPERSK